MPLVTLHATGYIYPVFVSNIPNLELWERIYYCGMKNPKTHSKWFCDDLIGAMDQVFLCKWAQYKDLLLRVEIYETRNIRL